jgi:hypothetical protein
MGKVSNIDLAVSKPFSVVQLQHYPIVWTDVLEPYGTLASVNKPIAVFGALSFEHVTPASTPPTIRGRAPAGCSPFSLQPAARV